MALAVAVTNVQVTDIFAEERAGAAESTGMAAEATPEQSTAGETETAQEENPAGETPEAEQQEDGDSENISYSDSETEATEDPRSQYSRISRRAEAGLRPSRRKRTIRTKADRAGRMRTAGVIRTDS